MTVSTDRDIRRVAVIGAGTIGGSFTQLFLRAGLDVALYDPSPEQLDRARARFADQDGSGQLTVEASLEDAMRDCDYAQECVPEQLEAKQSVFAAMSAAAPADAVLASSASAFTMSQIAEGAVHPERCVVVHPTNPPHLVPLVEVVPAPFTSPEVTEAAFALMQSIGQEPILCKKEVFGFVLNRLQFALEREAFYLVRQGVASAADVDKAVREGLGLRWAFLGPFGVEATNAESIEDDLRKFGTLMSDLFDAVCQPFSGPDEEDIAAAIAGVEEMFGDATQEELIDYRDSMVSAIRELKRSAPNDPFRTRTARSGGGA
jgi:L-gulonate 3-dehydrogenase